MSKSKPITLQQKLEKAGGIGKGWRLLAEGEPLMEGDGFLHPDFPEYWTDFKCRPEIFSGGGWKDSWYYIPKNDVAHTWPWRRKINTSSPS